MGSKIEEKSIEKGIEKVMKKIVTKMAKKPKKDATKQTRRPQPRSGKVPPSRRGSPFGPGVGARLASGASFKVLEVFLALQGFESLSESAKYTEIL